MVTSGRANIRMTKNQVNFFHDTRLEKDGGAAADAGIPGF